MQQPPTPHQHRNDVNLPLDEYDATRAVVTTIHQASNTTAVA
jgi:hypothetical protein